MMMNKVTGKDFPIPSLEEIGEMGYPFQGFFERLKGGKQKCTK
jgi:hypothetical protein